MQSQQFSPYRRSITFGAMIILSAILVLQPNLGLPAQTGYESLPVLSASKILPPELVKGPNHQVQ
jgi:hypothetical protein